MAIILVGFGAASGAGAAVRLAAISAIGAAGALAVGGFSAPTKLRGRDSDTRVYLHVIDVGTGANATEGLSSGPHTGGGTDVTVTLGRSGYDPVGVPAASDSYQFHSANSGARLTIKRTATGAESPHCQVEIGATAWGGGDTPATVTIVDHSGSGGTSHDLTLHIGSVGGDYQSVGQAAADLNAISAFTSAGYTAVVTADAKANFNYDPGADGFHALAGGQAGGPTPSTITSTRASVQALIDADTLAAAGIGALTGGSSGTLWTAGNGALAQLTGGGDWSNKAPSTVDGVAVSAGDRVLVSLGDFAQRFGLFVVGTVGSGSDGAWTRAPDKLLAPMLVAVTAGNTKAGKLYCLTGPAGAIAPDTTPLVISAVT